MHQLTCLVGALSVNRILLSQRWLIAPDAEFLFSQLWEMCFAVTAALGSRGNGRGKWGSRVTKFKLDYDLCEALVDVADRPCGD